MRSYSDKVSELLDAGVEVLIYVGVGVSSVNVYSLKAMLFCTAAASGIPCDGHLFTDAHREFPGRCHVFAELKVLLQRTGSATGVGIKVGPSLSYFCWDILYTHTPEVMLLLLLLQRIHMPRRE